MRSALLCLLLTNLLPAQSRSDQKDGPAPVNPVFRLEDGWTPLLNGMDLSGWRADGKGENLWLTTTSILWEPLTDPGRLRPAPGAGGTILNGPGSTVNLVTNGKWGDLELYLEFLLAKGSNSGVYLHGLYEVQIFDSANSAGPMKTSDGGAIYQRWIDNKGVGGSPPSRNASRPPGEWQSYRILFRAPRFDPAGKKTENARFLKVLHNAVSVQTNIEADGPTRSAMDIPEAAVNPIMLQGDHGPVAFRNIYVRSLREVSKS